MDTYGFWSLLPPLIAIVLALRTRQVFISLTVGIWVGWLIINHGNIGLGSMDTLQAFVDVFADAGNTRTILFTLIIGALIALIQRSGGVDGFIQWTGNKLKNLDNTEHLPANRLKIQAMTALTGVFIFVESNISILTAGTLYRPIFDKLKIPREKLAYLIDSSSAPSCIIFPFNAWGAYIMGLLVMQGIENPFGVLVRSIAFNFYPFLALAIVFYLILSKKDFGPMKKAMERADKEGKLLADGATPMVAEDISMLETKENTPLRARNMLMPIATMVVMMPILLIYTGWNETNPSVPVFSRVFEAIGHGSGSTAVFTAVTVAVLLAIVLFRTQKIMGIKEMADLSLKGMSGMVPLAILMVLAFAIGALCKQLGTGIYVAEITKAWLTPALVPAIVFVVSCFIAFSTGTSWGTFAIMISIAVPMAQSFDINLYLVIGAALGGGVFGDHCSPISDTTVISSMASASDHIDHVKTQLPYALTGGCIAFLLYLLLGVLG